MFYLNRKNEDTGETTCESSCPVRSMGNGDKAGAGILCVHRFRKGSPSVACGSTVSLFLWGPRVRDFD